MQHEENEVLHEAWLPLHEASEALGISPRAVQLRAEKGKIRRERRAGRVLFAVPVREAVHEAVHEESAALHAENEAVHEADTRPSDALVARLESEVEFLRARLEAADVEKAEMRRLLMVSEQNVGALQERVQKLLAAPGGSSVLPPNENSRQADGSLDDTANQPQEPPEATQTGAESQQRGFWQRWFGRK